MLLHHLWVIGEVYETLHNSSRVTVAAAALKQKPSHKSFQEEKRQKPKPSSGDCVNGLGHVPLLSATIGRQTDGSTG